MNVPDIDMRQHCTQKLSLCHKTHCGRNTILEWWLSWSLYITALSQFLISSVSQHIWPSSYLVFCTGIFKWLQHSWTHISRSYVYKNFEVGNDQTLEGYLSSDFEVLACCKSSDKTLGSKKGREFAEWATLPSQFLKHVAAHFS